ncbi:MAG: hypothetical protein R3E53_15180 [Myxococcota bacterium]
MGWSVSWSLVFAPVFLFPAAAPPRRGASRRLFEAEPSLILCWPEIASTLETLVAFFAVFALDITVFPDLKSSPRRCSSCWCSRSSSTRSSHATGRSFLTSTGPRRAPVAPRGAERGLL